MKKEIFKVKMKKSVPHVAVQTTMPLAIMGAICVLPVYGGEMFTFLLLFPLLTAIIGVSYGMAQGFFLGYPVLVGLSFLPTILLFLNITAVLYVIWYGGFGLIGMTLGYWTKKVFKLLKNASIKEKMG